VLNVPHASTANLPESEVEKLPPNCPAGVYFGWATLHGKQPVYEMVMSIGWNPYYKNEKKTAV
jgi:riboflavin kinase